MYTNILLSDQEDIFNFPYTFLISVLLYGLMISDAVGKSYLISWGHCTKCMFWQHTIHRNITRVFEYETVAFCMKIRMYGNMPGNNFNATGSRNSIKGTITNTENGTSLKRSPTVRTSCRFSLLVRLFPRTIFQMIFEVTRTSKKSNTKPDL